MQNGFFPWSDNWWIEEDKAWFCSGVIGALFCVNLNTMECELVDRVPECDLLNFRQYSYCAKWKDIVYCLPEANKCIWCYAIPDKTWKKIEMQDIGPILIYMCGQKAGLDSIWLMGYDSRRVLKLNMRKAMIEKEYILPRYENQYLGQYVLVGMKWYCINGKKIDCIDFESDDINTYELGDVKAELYTICYDGTNFWISSYCKEIYVWNPDQGIIQVLDRFPENLGICNYNSDGVMGVDDSSFISIQNPFFTQSISLGKYIWFIPYTASEIIYIDKVSYEVFSLEIGEEITVRGTYEKPYAMLGEYLVEYIREDRYIGLYSTKCRAVLEIDVVGLEIKMREYRLTERTLAYMAEEYHKERGILFEGGGWSSRVYYKNKSFFRQYIGKIDRFFFEISMQYRKDSNEEIEKGAIGQRIYHSLII